MGGTPIVMGVNLLSTFLLIRRLLYTVQRQAQCLTVIFLQWLELLNLTQLLQQQTDGIYLQDFRLCIY